MTNSAISTFTHVISVLYAGGAEPRFNMKMERLARLARIVVASIRVSSRNFMMALHDTRRQQAMLELQRWRHLNSHDDTGSSFKNDSIEKNKK